MTNIMENFPQNVTDVRVGSYIYTKDVSSDWDSFRCSAAPFGLRDFNYDTIERLIELGAAEVIDKDAAINMVGEIFGRKESGYDRKPEEDKILLSNQEIADRSKDILVEETEKPRDVSSHARTLSNDKPDATVSSIFYDGKEFYRDVEDFVYVTQFVEDGKTYEDETRISYDMVDKLLDSGEAKLATTYRFTIIDLSEGKENLKEDVVPHAPIDEVYEVITSNSKKVYTRDDEKFESTEGNYSAYHKDDVEKFLDKGTMYVKNTYEDKLKDLERCLDFLDELESDYIDSCTEYTDELQKVMNWLGKTIEHKRELISSLFKCVSEEYRNIKK